MKNLDLLAADKAQAIIREAIPSNLAPDKRTKRASEVENLVTKALGIVQENGIYAGMLYLYASKEGEIAKPVRLNLLALLPGLIDTPTVRDQIAQITESQNQTAAQAARLALNVLTKEVTSSLDLLFLVKQVWEQTLIYARYGAKTQG